MIREGESFGGKMDRYELVRKSLGVHLAENTVERSTNGSYACYYPVNAGSISYHSVRLNDLFMELHSVFILHHIMTLALSRTVLSETGSNS
jgi:hypothetical protein